MTLQYAPGAVDTLQAETIGRYAQGVNREAQRGYDSVYRCYENFKPLSHAYDYCSMSSSIDLSKGEWGPAEIKGHTLPAAHRLLHTAYYTLPAVH